MGRRAKSPKGKSPKDEGARVRDLEKRLAEALRREAEALDQQTATSEILRVISSSSTDVQPVFDTIVESAVRLCDGLFSGLYRFDGELIRQVAQHNYTPEALDALRRVLPVRPSRDFAVTRAILERAVVHIADTERDPEYRQVISRAVGARSILAVPMLRDGAAAGAIAVARVEPGPFSDKQIELLKTFADQAMIAIENVRLFTELQGKNRSLTEAHARVTEALEQQTATSEILRTIAQAQTDVQPVFETILERAVELCGAGNGSVFRFDGDLIHAVAHYNLPPATLEVIASEFPSPPSPGKLVGRTILSRQVVMIEDVLADEQYESMAPHVGGFRSLLGVPLLRESSPIGAIVIVRSNPGAFLDKQIALLQTFADQAVIAIENVRLFTELRERTAQLSRSVAELTALGQVSQALSSTLDIETVLTTIVLRAIELSGADGGAVYEYDDAAEEFRLRATQNFEEELVEASRAMPLRRGEGALGLLAERREPIQIADIADPAAYQSRVREVLLRTGYRAILAVPLLRDDRIVGALVMGRKSAGDFPPRVIDLLTTFANQSALAIQNARLFRELADKSRQLEAASRHKSEFLANMSHELRTPLNAIIGFSEVLAERMFGELNEKQEEYLKDIYASGQHLLSLINDILDLSKIEAGRMELEPAEFDLPTAIDNALILVRERAGRRGIALGRSIDERVGLIHADERKIKQVLLNLLSNALKFTPQGGRIDVRATMNEGEAEISVSDTGVGIAPEDQEAIFEEFRQVGATDKRVEGTGLGLSLARKFIELHGGRIWVKSQVGVGSTFTFTIPVPLGE
jgi:two-component system, NtrC family, sensor kinase